MHPGLAAQAGVEVTKQRFEALPISAEHALAAGQQTGPHRDPFDRMLMAQTHNEQADVVTTDPVFRNDGVAVRR